MLLRVGGNAGFERIIRYCSTGGQLDDGKVERLLVGDISVLKDAIDQIGIIEDTDVENKFENAYNVRTTEASADCARIRFSSCSCISLIVMLFPANLYGPFKQWPDVLQLQALVYLASMDNAH